MKLTLDPLDLRPEFQEKTEKGLNKSISTSQITFCHFTDMVQIAICTVGEAVFYSWDHKTHNVIYPPR